MSAITAANANTKQAYRGIYLDFNLNLNWPPPCNTGFLPARQQRIPTDVDAPDRPSGELYCRVPQNSDLNVRGVRNIPCETKPWKRAPTVEICESDEEYVPLNDGYNWKGDPNATLSGQGVPQYPPGVSAPGEPPPPIAGSAPNTTGAPALAAPVTGTPVGGAPQNVAVAVYDPATGGYIGPDGRRYTQGDLAQSGERTWESMLVPSA
jgi:phospholipid/cholesterol/gamma-HCH transport system substrate-binding protein